MKSNNKGEQKSSTQQKKIKSEKWKLCEFKLTSENEEREEKKTNKRENGIKVNRIKKGQR